MTGKSAGFDFGLQDVSHRQRRERETRPAAIQTRPPALPRPTRRLSKKRLGSQNRTERKPIWPVSIAVWPRLRQAFHWGLAHDLCVQYDTIRLETLNLQGMKALWGRKVSDLGFATFVDILHHVATSMVRWSSISTRGIPRPNAVMCVAMSITPSHSGSGSGRVRRAGPRIGAISTPQSISTRSGHRPLEKTLSDWPRSARVVDPRIPLIMHGEYVNSHNPLVQRAPGAPDAERQVETSP